jgi:hypothetical protein
LLVRIEAFDVKTSPHIMSPTDTPRATTKLPLASHSGKKRKITHDTATKTSEEVMSDPNRVGSSAAKHTKIFHGSRNASEGMSKKYLYLPILQGNEDMLLENEECAEVGMEYSMAKKFAQPQKVGNSRKKKTPSSTAGNDTGDTTARAVKKNVSKKTYALHNTTEVFSPAGEYDEDVIIGNTPAAPSTFVTSGPISIAAFATGVKTRSEYPIDVWQKIPNTFRCSQHSPAHDSNLNCSCKHEQYPDG